MDYGDRLLAKYNPYHDDLGRFTFAESASFASITNDKAVARERAKYEAKEKDKEPETNFKHGNVTMEAKGEKIILHTQKGDKDVSNPLSWKIPENQKAGFRAAGFDPAKWRFLQGRKDTVVVKNEVADAAMAHQAKVTEWHEAKLERNVPGLSELRAARESDAAAYRQNQRNLNSEGHSIERASGGGNLAELNVKYPRASLYLKAEGYEQASNYMKASAGKKARESLAAGGSEKEARSILENWGKA